MVLLVEPEWVVSEEGGRGFGILVVSGVDRGGWVARGV